MTSMKRMRVLKETYRNLKSIVPTIKKTTQVSTIPVAKKTTTLTMHQVKKIMEMPKSVEKSIYWLGPPQDLVAR